MEEMKVDEDLFKSGEDHDPAIELQRKRFDEEPLLKRKTKKLYYSNSELEVALKPPLPKEKQFDILK